jgi:hypothetical protein
MEAWDLDPNEVIEEIAAKYENCFDAEILSELVRLPALPEEDNPCWDDLKFWLDSAYKLDALFGIATGRKLFESIGIVLSKMCHGDPGEMMRGYCHGFEYVVAPDYERLIEPYRNGTQSERLGTKIWSLTFLSRIRKPKTKPIFEQYATDSNDEIRCIATRGLSKLESAE